MHLSHKNTSFNKRCGISKGKFCLSINMNMALPICHDQKRRRWSNGFVHDDDDVVHRTWHKLFEEGITMGMSWRVNWVWDFGPKRTVRWCLLLRSLMKIGCGNICLREMGNKDIMTGILVTVSCWWLLRTSSVRKCRDHYVVGLVVGFRRQIYKVGSTPTALVKRRVRTM